MICSFISIELSLHSHNSVAYPLKKSIKCALKFPYFVGKKSISCCTNSPCRLPLNHTHGSKMELQNLLQPEWFQRKRRVTIQGPIAGRR